MGPNPLVKNKALFFYVDAYKLLLVEHQYCFLAKIIITCLRGSSMISLPNESPAAPSDGPIFLDL